ncbi:hypothetical protein HIM_08120 [Hirsutella minnesotensis 3608]|uniref:Glycosyltransferase family 25 protein n=1 Tax=Hirsutella minnesotensis 3608 TaxID=1043627 RepID=A0A0F7ZHD5_9HYPO|nr:hypothetical protein HIM_08120 [Hirsutella minnesotensis 3608]
MVLQAALSQISIDFIDGLAGSSIPEKAIPENQNSGHIVNAELGSWRGHMNAIQEVVRKNMTSVLIMEDDGDWDIRIKKQLYNFALASQALTQPLAGQPGLYADPSYPKPSNETNTITEISFDHLPVTAQPKISPYGDEWDVLWLGHCAQTFPTNDNHVLPLGRVIQYGDETVPLKKYLDSPYIKPFVLKDDYPDHARAVHHSQWGACTLGYAVSQQGARKILREIGLKKVNAPYDLLLRTFCDGNPGRGENKCLTTQPSLMVHHLQAGSTQADSDIKTKDGKEEYRKEGVTKEIRWSVRLNADALLKGETTFADQYPDDG